MEGHPSSQSREVTAFSELWCSPFGYCDINPPIDLSYLPQTYNSTFHQSRFEAPQPTDHQCPLCGNYFNLLATVEMFNPEVNLEQNLSEVESLLSILPQDGPVPGSTSPLHQLSELPHFLGNVLVQRQQHQDLPEEELRFASQFDTSGAMRSASELGNYYVPPLASIPPSSFELSTTVLTPTICQQNQTTSIIHPQRILPRSSRPSSPLSRSPQNGRRCTLRTGHNKTGRKGIQKCRRCRKHHSACIFTDSGQACGRCRKGGLSDVCGEKVFGPEREKSRR